VTLGANPIDLLEVVGPLLRLVSQGRHRRRLFSGCNSNFR
jgi:hypothetical protein